MDTLFYGNNVLWIFGGGQYYYLTADPYFPSTYAYKKGSKRANSISAVYPLKSGNAKCYGILAQKDGKIWDQIKWCWSSYTNITKVVFYGLLAFACV